MPLQALIKVTDTKTNDVFSTFTYFIAVSFPSSQNHFSLLFFSQKSSFYLLFYFIYLYLSMMGFFLVSPSVYLASQLSTVSDIIFGLQAVGFLEDFA